MRTPKLKLRSMRPPLRRPSPAMAVAVAALFMSVGGASYAAYALPANSVGHAQLTNDSVQTNNIKPYNVTTWRIANGAVNFRKIKPGSVGRVRIQKSTVQLRVNGACTGANQAISSIDINGGAACANTSPIENDTGVGKVITLNGNMTAVASQSLVGGSAYLVQAQPYIEVTSGATDTVPETVNVTCTLAAGTATTATITRTQTVELTAQNQTQYTTLPLTVTAPEGPNSLVAPVNCSEKTVGSGTASPTVTAQATVYATTINQPTTTTTPAPAK